MRFMSDNCMHSERGAGVDLTTGQWLAKRQLLGESMTYAIIDVGQEAASYGNGDIMAACSESERSRRTVRGQLAWKV